MPTRFFGSLISSFECTSLTGCRGGFATTLGLPTVVVLPSVVGGSTILYILDFDTFSSICSIVLSNLALDFNMSALSWFDFLSMSLMSHSTVPCGGLLFFPVVATDAESSIALNVFGPGMCSTPPENLTLLFDFGAGVVSAFWESFCSSCLSTSLKELGLGVFRSSGILTGCPVGVVPNWIPARVLLRD